MEKISHNPEPSEQVEIYFSARNLKKMDAMSNTDCKLSIRSLPDMRVVGETEIINNDLNPDFTTSFILDFYFEKHQYFQVICLDAENSSGTDNELIGIVEFELGKVLGSRENMLVKDILKKGKKKGSLIVRAESVIKGTQIKLDCELRGLNLTNFGFFNKIKPYLTISKPKLSKMELKRFSSGDAKIEDLKLDDEDWITVYQSGKMKEKHPLFPFLSIRNSKLCSGPLVNPIKVKNNIFFGKFLKKLFLKNLINDHFSLLFSTSKNQETINSKEKK